MTVRDFVKGVFSDDNTPFSLSNSDRIHERWRGKNFAQLMEEEKRKIRNTTIHAIIFMQQHPEKGDTSLYQIFERINTSGRSLLPQEIRNCVYQGALNSLLFELNTNAKWRSLWGEETQDSRMYDLEMILRFFTLSDDWIFDSNPNPPKISLKKSLNEYMGKVRSQLEINGLREKFIQTVDFVHESFGITAFNNLSPSDTSKFVNSLSSTVFDAIMIASWKVVKEKLPKKTATQYQDKKIQVLKNSDYQKSLSQETMRIKNIRKRVDEMFNALKE